jgi:hypothetical protein
MRDPGNIRLSRESGFNIGFTRGDGCFFPRALFFELYWRMSSSLDRTFILNAIPVPPVRAASPAGFLENWQQRSPLLRGFEPERFRAYMAAALKHLNQASRLVLLDPSTPDSFVDSLVKADILKIL